MLYSKINRFAESSSKKALLPSNGIATLAKYETIGVAHPYRISCPFCSGWNCLQDFFSAPKAIPEN